MSKNVIGGLSLLMALALTGCAKVPQQEVDSAHAALETAQSADAAAYAAESLSKAEASMQQAEAEIAAQDEKLFKSYDKAGELLAQAKTDAEKAAADAAAGKQAAMDAAGTAIADATFAVDAAAQAVATAPASKDKKADVEAMNADLDTLRGLLSEAQGAYDAGDYNTARERAEQVKTEADAISADVQQAQGKTV